METMVYTRNWDAQRRGKELFYPVWVVLHLWSICFHIDSPFNRRHTSNVKERRGRGGGGGKEGGEGEERGVLVTYSFDS